MNHPESMFQLSGVHGICIYRHMYTYMCMLLQNLFFYFFAFVFVIILFLLLLILMSTVVPLEKQFATSYELCFPWISARVYMQK